LSESALHSVENFKVNRQDIWSPNEGIDWCPASVFTDRHV
jgi:hypothetical protein